jgi:hypothetical protein
MVADIAAREAGILLLGETGRVWIGGTDWEGVEDMPDLGVGILLEEEVGNQLDYIVLARDIQIELVEDTLGCRGVDSEDIPEVGVGRIVPVVDPEDSIPVAGLDSMTLQVN